MATKNKIHSHRTRGRISALGITVGTVVKDYALPVLVALTIFIAGFLWKLNAKLATYDVRLPALNDGLTNTATSIENLKNQISGLQSQISQLQGELSVYEADQYNNQKGRK